MNSKLTWPQAFKILLSDVRKKGVTGIKGLIFWCAIAWPFIFGFQQSVYVLKLQGDIPPKTSLISTTGVLDSHLEKHGLKEVRKIQFVSDDGTIYPVERPAYFKEAVSISGENAPHIGVQGFLLKNKTFWFTEVRLEKNGQLLLNSKTSFEELEKLRSIKRPLIFGILVWIFLIALSTYNASLIKKCEIQGDLNA